MDNVPCSLSLNLKLNHVHCQIFLEFDFGCDGWRVLPLQEPEELVVEFEAYENYHQTIPNNKTVFENQTLTLEFSDVDNTVNNT